MDKHAQRDGAVTLLVALPHQNGNIHNDVSQPVLDVDARLLLLVQRTLQEIERDGQFSAYTLELFLGRTDQVYPAARLELL